MSKTYQCPQCGAAIKEDNPVCPICGYEKIADHIRNVRQAEILKRQEEQVRKQKEREERVQHQREQEERAREQHEKEAQLRVQLEKEEQVRRQQDQEDIIRYSNEFNNNHNRQRLAIVREEDFHDLDEEVSMRNEMEQSETKSEETTSSGWETSCGCLIIVILVSIALAIISILKIPFLVVLLFIAVIAGINFLGVKKTLIIVAIIIAIWMIFFRKTEAKGAEPVFSMGSIASEQLS